MLYGCHGMKKKKKGGVWEVAVSITGLKVVRKDKCAEGKKEPCVNRDVTSHYDAPSSLRVSI